MSSESSDLDKFYIVIAQRQCDDPYYAPYNDPIGYYKSKELAIESARRYRKRTKKYSSSQDCYYVQECYFHDNDTVTDADASSNDENENDTEENKEWKKELEKYNYYGEDEEIFFDETEKVYKQGKMIYVIQRKQKEKEGDKLEKDKIE